MLLRVTELSNIWKYPIMICSLLPIAVQKTAARLHTKEFKGNDIDYSIENQSICRIPDMLDCEYLPSGFYEYPYDCNAYISCSDSHAELKYCSTGKLYNDQLQICDTPESVNCTELECPTASPKDCVGVENHTVLPSFEHCDQFIVCMNQQVVLQQCPNQLVFNPYLLICDNSEEGWCYGDNTTATVTTESTETTSRKPIDTLPTTTESETESDPCIGETEGVSFPLETDCHQYILCLGNDDSFIAKCPVNAWFDPKTGTCGPDVSPTACLESESASTTPRATPSPDELCEDQELGTSYPLKSNCKQYILCLGEGESAIVNCIFNAWYDPKTGNCGPNVSPTACEESDVTTNTEAPTTPSATQSTTQSTSTKTTTDKPNISEICGDLINGEYVAYPDNCEKYIVCVHPVPIAFYCTPGYYFSEIRQECVDWEKSDCNLMASTVLPPGHTTPPESPTICTNNTGSTFPYTEECKWFIRCINDNVYMMCVCNIGEYYDPLIGQCSINASPDACREDYTSSTTEMGKSTTTTIIITTATTPEAESEPCIGVAENKLVPYPNDCTKFIKCEYPTSVVYDCVEGQEFSATLERCMAPWSANCTFTTTTKAYSVSTATTTTTETTTAQLPKNICDGITDGSIVSYPNNCTKFILCQNPIPVGYDCPTGEELSLKEFRCMDPKLANCSSKASY